VPKLPEPPTPDVLAAIGPAWHEVPDGAELWRVYFRGGAHPTTWNTFRAFGPVNARFDHHRSPTREQERGFFCGTASPITCLAEVYQTTRRIHARLNEPWLVGFATARPLRLLDLTGTWPTRAGASMALASGPRAWARSWSAAIYDLYPEIGGLWYPSSMAANRPSFAFYERAATALPAAPVFHRALADPLLFPWLRAAADEFGYGLV
jgi:hypothetical protein